MSKMTTKQKKCAAIPNIAREGEKALRAAVADVVAEHKRTGNPLAVWHNGQAVMLPANQAVAAVHEAHGEYRTKSKKGSPHHAH